MTRRTRLAGALLATLLTVPVWGNSTAQPAEVHGATATFAAPGLVVAWAILRGPTEETTRVVLRITAVGTRYRLVAVEAVDPFAGGRQAVLQARPIGPGLDVSTPRAGFADLPRREIRLYATEDDARAGQPALTVYYLGVPDTTPEFAAEPALQRYLDDAVAAARAAAGGAP
jgi:hypothetical protein